MLHRVVPWLWRLADEDATRPAVLPDMQKQLLQALRSCPAADDIQVSSIVMLLDCQAVVCVVCV